MRTLAVIPSRYEPERLRSLHRCLDDVDVLILDNGHVPRLPWGRVIENAAGLGIYAMWNRGWRTARQRGYDVVALLNDDIRILPGTVSLMARALAEQPQVGVVYPDWPLPLTSGLPKTIELRHTEGTVSVGGMTGFCFAFRSDLPVAPFDERLTWWYGDDAFERNVRRARFTVSKIIGLPCEHESDSERDNWARRPELREAVERDRVLWEAMA